MLAAVRSHPDGVMMSSEDCLEAFCSCLSDARELSKLNSVFEGSTLVSAKLLQSFALFSSVVVEWNSFEVCCTELAQ